MASLRRRSLDDESPACCCLRGQPAGIDGGTVTLRCGSHRGCVLPAEEPVRWRWAFEDQRDDLHDRRLLAQVAWRWFTEPHGWLPSLHCPWERRPIQNARMHPRHNSCLPSGGFAREMGGSGPNEQREQTQCGNRSRSAGGLAFRSTRPMPIYANGRILPTVEGFGSGLMLRDPFGSTRVRPTETRGAHLDEKRSRAHSSQMCPKATADLRCRRSVRGICDTSPFQPQRRHTPRCGCRIGVMLQSKLVTEAPPSCFASRGYGPPCSRTPHDLYPH